MHYWGLFQLGPPGRVCLMVIRPGAPRLSRTIYRSMEYLIRAGQRLLIPPGGAQSPCTAHNTCLSSLAVLGVYPGQTCILYALMTKAQDCPPPGRMRRDDVRWGHQVAATLPAPPAAPTALSQSLSSL